MIEIKTDICPITNLPNAATIGLLQLQVLPECCSAAHRREVPEADIRGSICSFALLDPQGLRHSRARARPGHPIKGHSAIAGINAQQPRWRLQCSLSSCSQSIGTKIE